MTKSFKQKRQFWIILFIVFLGFLGISIPYLIFPALFLNTSYSILADHWSYAHRAIFLGITLAVYPLGQFIGSPILGSLADGYGRKKLVAISLFITAICNLFTGLAIKWHYLHLLIASRFLAGLMEGNVAIARAMAADLTTIAKYKTFGKINAAASIAFLIGPLLGGIMTNSDLVSYFNNSTPFYFICILFFLLAILCLVAIEEEQREIVKNEQTFWQRIHLINRLSTLLSQERLGFLLLTSTCFTLAVDIFYEFAPVYLTLKWHLDPSDLVIYNGILCLTLAIGNGWLPTFMANFFSSRYVILSSMGAFAFFLLAIVYTNAPNWMLFWFALSGFVIGLVVTLITVKISNSVPSSMQAEVMGVQISLRVLGDAFICLFGGALLLLSSTFILVIASLLSCLAMFYYLLKGRLS